VASEPCGPLGFSDTIWFGAHSSIGRGEGTNGGVASARRWRRFSIPCLGVWGVSLVVLDLVLEGLQRSWLDLVPLHPYELGKVFRSAREGRPYLAVFHSRRRENLCLLGGEERVQRNKRTHHTFGAPEAGGVHRYLDQCGQELSGVVTCEGYYKQVTGNPFPANATALNVFHEAEGCRAIDGERSNPHLRP